MMLLLTHLFPVLPLNVIPIVDEFLPHICSPVSLYQSLNSIEKKEKVIMTTMNRVHTYFILGFKCLNLLYELISEVLDLLIVVHVL